MSAPAKVSSMQLQLGRGKIGTITPEHVKAVNDWLAPLADRDELGRGANLSAGDINNLLELGRVNNVRHSGNLYTSTDLQNLLLVDLGQAVTQVRWGNGPWEEDAITSIDMRVRLTRRGRIMLQRCVPDLWKQMLYGSPE